MSTVAISVILIAPDAAAGPAVCVRGAVAEGLVTEVVHAAGPFNGLACAFAEAAEQCAGELILALTPDTELEPDAWTAIAATAQANPDAGAFTLGLGGLSPDPAWRGRRCRSHERNLESQRFASLIAPGALVVRRAALLTAIGEAPLPASADWWSELTRRVCRATQVVALPVRGRRRRLLPGEPPTPGFAPPARRPHVLVLGQIEVSTSLYFDFLEASGDVAVGFRAFTRLSVDAAHLAAADLVILVRTLHRFWDEGVIAFLEAAGTPWVWFTDDNFQALAAERDAPSFFAPGRVARALAGAAEVWASTPALAAALEATHPRVALWGPVLDPALAGAPPAPAGVLTVAISGGDFRVAGLSGAAVDGLRAIAARQPLRVIATEAAAGALAASLPGAEIVARPMQRSFRQFVRTWRRFAIDILLHPAGPTANAPYKCPTATIVAGYLGAVPVVADEPAYAGWGEAEGLLRLAAAGEGLVEAADLARSEFWRGEMRQRLAAALAQRFGDAGRIARLQGAMRPSPSAPVDATSVLASPAFARRRAGLSLAYATRRIRDPISPPG